MIDLPDFDENRAEQPSVSSNEQTWYAVTVSGSEDKLSAFKQAQADMAFNGRSALLDVERQRLVQQQSADNNATVAEILNDDTIDVETKKTVLRNHIENKDVNEDLRKKYRNQYAVAAIPEEHQNLTQPEDLQSAVIDRLVERDKEAAKLQADINSLYGMFNDPSVLSEAVGHVSKAVYKGVGSLAGSEFISGVADSDAGSLGTVTLGAARDVLPITGLAFNAEVAASVGATGGSIGDIVIASIFSGTGLDKLQKKYASLPMEGKREFISDILDALKKVPGTDYNKFNALNQVILGDGELPTWKVVAENISSVLNFVGVGGVFKKGTEAATAAEKSSSGGVVRNTVVKENIPLLTHNPNVSQNVPLLTPPPRGPAGTVAVASPGQANKLGQEIIKEAAENTGTSKTAEAMGTTPGEIVGGWSMPKLDDVQLHNPNITESITKLDEYFEGLFNETARNPAVVNIGERTTKADEYLNYMGRSMNGVYQQSNSVIEFTLGETRGTAMFGKTNNYGFTNLTEAQNAAARIEGATVVTKGNEHFVKVDWKQPHDFLSDMAFGADATKTTFLGMDVSNFANTTLGRWLFNPTTRLPEWVTKGAATTTLGAKRIEGEFMKAIGQKIAPLRNNKKFISLMVETGENQRWFTASEIRAKFPEASAKEMDKIMDGYAHYKRFVDYEYNWANRLDRAQKEQDGLSALYKADGEMIGYGKEVEASSLHKNTMVWDTESQTAVRVPEGAKVYKTNKPVRDGNNEYEYVLAANHGKLPRQTMPRIEGYVPRRNVEKFYMVSTPKKMNVNGFAHSGDMQRFSRVVGAARTEKEARIYMEQLQKELGEDVVISFKADRSDNIDSLITDADLYSKSSRISSSRGERLKTLDGVAQLEDPLVTFQRTVKAITRMGIWDDYDTVLRKNFVKAYGHMTEGKFPNHISDIKLPKNASKEMEQQHRNAQNLFEYRKNIEYRTTLSDDAWKYVMNGIGDVLEKVKYTGFNDVIRKSAQSGNPIVRAAKGLGHTLFLKLNPARQWLVQTQQQLELYAMNPAFAMRAIRQTPGVFAGVMSKADKLATYDKALYETGRVISGLGKEYDEIVEAVLRSGIPESVDLNMMVGSIFGDVSRGIRESTGRRVWEGMKTAGNIAPNIGNKLGYGSAEFSNTLGTWLFARERWIKNNPGKDWKLPENIQKITGDGWDINHSMSTRAGAFPYQDGMLGVIFQFTAVQHKAFMQVFSSKTLSSVEKGKLAAARAVLYGGKAGIPLGGAAYYFAQHSDSPVVQEYSEQFKTGVADWLLNNTIDLFLNQDLDPDKEWKPSDLNVSSMLSPLPNTLPYMDFIIGLKNMADDIPYNSTLRIPFLGASGNVFNIAKDISNMYAVETYDTKESLEMAGMMLLESMSSYNNFAKYMMLKNFGDKVSKLGRNYGLNVIESNMGAQLVGITTQEEIDMFELKALQKDRTDFVKQTSDEIYTFLQKMNNRQGEMDDFYTYSKKLRNMLTHVDPDIRAEIIKEVDSKARFNMASNKENVYEFLFKHYKQDGNDKFIRQMIMKLKDSKDPRDQKVLNQFFKEGLINAD